MRYKGESNDKIKKLINEYNFYKNKFANNIIFDQNLGNLSMS